MAGNRARRALSTQRSNRYGGRLYNCHIKDMSNYSFQLVNVFTDSFYGGNPLAVFTDARGLSDQDMQAIARQMNLSETVFLFPSESADAALRIFTPAYEMPFAGHPTLGSAFVVARLRGLSESLQLQTQAGVIPVRINGTHFTLTANPPKLRAADFARAEAAATFRLSVEDIASDPVWINTGAEQLLIELSSREAVLAAKPELERFYLHCGLNPDAYLWYQANGVATVRLFFGDNGSIREDPGTGSACANLGGWCVLNEQPLPLAWRVEQGHKLQRLNRLSLEVSASGEIRVGGEVVFVGQGELCLP